MRLCDRNNRKTAFFSIADKTAVTPCGHVQKKLQKKIATESRSPQSHRSVAKKNKNSHNSELIIIFAQKYLNEGNV
jgi:hypothetical protein